MNDRNICFGFEPQNIIKDRCKKCFRLHSVHETASSKPSLRSNSSNHVKNSGIKDTTAGVERQQQSRLIEIRKQRLASVSLRSSMGTRQNSGRTRRTPEKASAAKRRSSDGETSTRVSATKPETGVSAKKVSRKVDKTEPTRDNVTTPTPYLTVEVHPASNRSSPIHRITVDELLENGNNASSSSNQPPDEPFGTVKTQNTVKKSVQEVPPKLRPHSSQNPGSAGDNGTDFNKRPNSCSVLMLKQQSTISFTSSTTSPIQKTFPANDFESPPPNSSDLCLSDKSSKAERKRTIRSAERHPNEDPVDYEDSASLASSYKTARSKMSGGTVASSSGMVSAKSMESISSTNYESLISSASVLSPDDDEFGTPTWSRNADDEMLRFLERTLTPTEAAEFEHIEMSQFRMENSRLLEQCKRLKNERKEWMSRLKSRGIKLVGSQQGLAGDTEEAPGSRNQQISIVIEERINELERLIGEYREENSTLKCELRQIQNIENISAIATNIAKDAADRTAEKSQQRKNDEEEKLRCVALDLQHENEKLKSEIHDLQQEMNEIGDQYREEQIDEFREMQRELEQNSKDCRILQFKLRKLERQREHLLTENSILANRCKQDEDGNDDSLTSNLRRTYEEFPEMHSEGKVTRRSKELESELRIAKEVSVRLHNELELSEDKRYKLEDEVFYYKEKVRELQTQNKWREGRNKSEQSTKSGPSEKPMTGDSGMSRELRDVLEREADLKDQLRFSEEDLRRTKFRLHELENESEDLLEKYSKLCCEISTNHQQGMTQSLIVSSPYAEEDKWRVPQIARRVSDGEQPNEKLQQPKLELEQLEQQNTSSSRDQQKSEKQASKNGEEATTNMKFLEVELRKEKQEREELGKTVAYYKQFIASTGEHKMKILNTEMEMLKNQSTMLKERIDFLHSQEKLPSNASSEYVDRLKARCDSLEEELAQMKAEQDFRLMETAESTDKNANEIDNGKALATSDDIEQACIMLASVDAQANRIFKQLEKLDGGNISKAERRRSLNKEGLHYANLVVDLANVLTELRILHQLLHYKRLLPQDSTSESSMVTIVATASNNKDDNTNLLLTPPNSAHCKECSKSESNISDLREEVIFYKKKNKELTNQILRTDQWHAEMERQEKTHAASVIITESELKRVRQQLFEQIEIAKTTTALLSERSQLVGELKTQLGETNKEIERLRQQIRELEHGHKTLKGWELKYNQLSSMYEKEHEKFERDRERMKAEAFETKKRADETASLCNETQHLLRQREQSWAEIKTKMTTEMAQLRRRACNDGDVIEDIPIETVQYNGSKAERKELDDSIMNSDHELRLKDKVADLDKRNKELTSELSKINIKKEEVESELNSERKKWAQEKEALMHKHRQETKLNNTEKETLRGKLDSRIAIMENTNRTLNTQLFVARKERDSQAELLDSYKQQQGDDQGSRKVGLQQEIRYRMGGGTYQQQQNGIEKYGYGSNENKIDALRERVFKEKAMELMEQIKVLEIDQRNLVEASEISRNQLHLEQERFKQVLRQIELQRTARRYKISALVAQLSSIPSQLSRQEKNRENEMIIENAIAQLNYLIRNEDDQLLATRLIESSRPIMLTRPAPEREPLRSKPPQKSASMNVIGPIVTHKNSPGSRTHKDIIDSNDIMVSSFSSSIGEWGRDLREMSTNMARSVSPVKKHRMYNDNMDTSEFSMRRGYNWNISNDKSMAYDSTMGHNRTSSSGTNIVYRVRREELAKGSMPSVKLMANAFESLSSQNKPQEKQKTRKTVAKLLGLKKSHSAECGAEAVNTSSSEKFLIQHGIRKGEWPMSKNQQETLTKQNSSESRSREQGSNQSIPFDITWSQMSESVEDSRHQSLDGITSQIIPNRGARNPFKGIGTRIAETVRRSLSRTRNRSQSYDQQDRKPSDGIKSIGGTKAHQHSYEMTAEKLPPVPKELTPSSRTKILVKTKRKTKSSTKFDTTNQQQQSSTKFDTTNQQQQSAKP